MATIVENLGKELEDLDRDYANHFAGQSRLTRDISVLDKIVERGVAILQRIDQIPSAAQGPELVRLRDTASSNVNLYKQERNAILRAQEVGPTFEAFSVEATNANLTFSRYARHFAGKDRTTRDLALLGELIEDLKQIDKRMNAILEDAPNPDFMKDHRIVRENLTQYQSEVELIDRAQKSGGPEERSSTLATLANNQFAIYQGHFAGEARVSRRPMLLMRVISSLKKILERMTTFRDGGASPEYNERNISIVETRLQAYEAELTEIRKIRQATSMSDIMNELGGAANRLFEQYRSAFADKSRTQVDLNLLGLLCDKLGEVRRQMAEMSMAEDNDMNTKNLDIVNEQLVMFEGEHEAVVRAVAQQTGGTSGTGSKLPQ